MHTASNFAVWLLCVWSLLKVFSRFCYQILNCCDLCHDLKADLTQTLLWSCVLCSICADKAAVPCKSRSISTFSLSIVWTECLLVILLEMVRSFLSIWKHVSQDDFICALPTLAECLILSHQSCVSRLTFVILRLFSLNFFHSALFWLWSILHFCSQQWNFFIWNLTLVEIRWFSSV